MGADTRSTRTTVLQPAEQSPQTQEARQNETAEEYVPDGATRENPKEQLSEVETDIYPVKEGLGSSLPMLQK